MSGRRLFVFHFPVMAVQWGQLDGHHTSGQGPSFGFLFVRLSSLCTVAHCVCYFHTMRVGTLHYLRKNMNAAAPLKRLPSFLALFGEYGTIELMDEGGDIWRLQ
jgi:hypothetical protein